MWLDCGKRVILKISNAGSRASYGPYHGLDLPNYWINFHITCVTIGCTPILRTRMLYNCMLPLPYQLQRAKEIRVVAFVLVVPLSDSWCIDFTFYFELWHNCRISVYCRLATPSIRHIWYLHSQWLYYQCCLNFALLQLPAILLQMSGQNRYQSRKSDMGKISHYGVSGTLKQIWSHQWPGCCIPSFTTSKSIFTKLTF